MEDLIDLIIMHFKISMFDFDVSLAGIASGKRQPRGEVSGAATAEASVVIYDGNKPITLSADYYMKSMQYLASLQTFPRPPKQNATHCPFARRCIVAVSGAVPRTKSFYCSDFNPPLQIYRK